MKTSLKITFTLLIITMMFLLSACFLFESNYQIKISPTYDVNPVGTSHTLSINVSKTGIFGGPVIGASISLNITGANPLSSVLTSDQSGNATFTYVGMNVGSDTIVVTTSGVSTTAVKIWIRSATDIKNDIMAIVSTFDEDMPQTFSNVEKIVAMGDETIPVLTSLLSTSNSLKVRWASIYSLSRVGNPDKTGGAVVALQDPNETIRTMAAAIFVGTGDATSLSILHDAENSNSVMMYSIPAILLSEFASRSLNAQSSGIRYEPTELYGYSPAISLDEDAEIQKFTVTKDDVNCEIRVNLYIELKGSGATSSLANTWENGIESVWNGADGYRKFGCYKVIFNVDVKVNTGGTPEASREQIEVVSIPPTQTHTSFVNGLGTPNNGSVGGEWDNQDTGNVAAHEAGHLMGLDDEYTYDASGNYVNSNPQDTDPQSIMAQTWGSVSALQSHINAIMENAGISAPATMTVIPASATNFIGSTHTVTANVRDTSDRPLPNVEVTFKVSGLNNLTGKATTDDMGNAALSYTYNGELEGKDTIVVKADCCLTATVVKFWKRPTGPD